MDKVLIGRRIRTREILVKGQCFRGKPLPGKMVLFSDGTITAVQPCMVHPDCLTARIEIEGGHLKEAIAQGRYSHSHYWHSLVPGSFEMLDDEEQE